MGLLDACDWKNGGESASVFSMIDEPREPVKPPAANPSVPPPVSPSEPPPPANTLTPEEQMALFERELKETDWGHQPC